MLDSDELAVKNCDFIKNTDQLIRRAKTVDRCTFQQNTAQHFDTIENAQSITNSKFIKNLLIITNVGTMQNNRFESNDCKYHMIENAGTVDGCTFTGNNILLFIKCKTLKNSRFENNRADIVKNGGSVSNCRFTGNTGGITFLNVLSITGSYFKNNKDCFIKNKKLTVKNTKFINVKGTIAGKKIDRCTFSNNDMDVTADTIVNSKFTKNLFKVYRVEAKTIKKCQFVKNRSTGTILSANTIANSKFIKNTCNGGVAGATKVYNCRFEKNTVAKKTAGNVVSAKLVKKCVFLSNIGKKDSIVSSASLIDGCTFKNNKVTDFFSGVVYFVKKVTNTKFINNKILRGYGGALDDVGVVKKCTFKNNYALVGGAISTVGKCTIEKCTFTKNKAKYSGSAIYLSALPTALKAVIKNCKFSKNKAKGKLNTYDYPFKNYGKGTIFAFGDYKMSIKVKKCKGL